jgi:uncharacterized phiE125 gp8 family phage protein
VPSIRHGEIISSPPAWEPVTLAEMKSHLRIIGQDGDNDYINYCITAAREYVEAVTKRAIPQQTIVATWDAFPGRQIDDYRPPGWRYGIIRLPRPPLQSVVAVEYYAANQGNMPLVYTTLSATEYQVDATSEPGRLAPAPNKVWPPTTPLALAAVRVTFICGWPSASEVPSRIKQAIKLIAGHIYDHREDSVEVALTRIPTGMRAFAAAAAPWSYF